MKIKSWFNLFVLLFLFLGLLCTSCTPKFSKPSTFPLGVTEKTDFIDIENLMQEALRLYHQGRLPEASQKLEIVARIIPEDPPTWSAVILYSMLAFLQEKSADTTKARITYKVVENLLGGVKGTLPESEVVATRLLRYGRQLKGQDRLQLLERFLPLASKTQGKAGAALTAVSPHIVLPNPLPNISPFIV